MTYSVIVVTLTVLLLVAAWVYPYVTAIMAKARMLKALRVAARSAGFKYRRSYKNIFLVRNLSRKFDMIIYNDKKLYAIKLWSSYFAYNTLVITQRGRIREERRTRPVFITGDLTTVYAKGVERRVPKTSLYKKYMKGREVERVMLVYPSYEAIKAETPRGTVKLKTGDGIFGNTVYSPSVLMRRIREDGEAFVKNGASPEGQILI